MKTAYVRRGKSGFEWCDSKGGGLGPTRCCIFAVYFGRIMGPSGLEDALQKFKVPKLTEESLRSIDTGSGTTFDVEVVRAFAKAALNEEVIEVSR